MVHQPVAMMQQREVTIQQPVLAVRAVHRGLRMMLAAGFGVWLIVVGASSPALGLTTSALMDQTCAGYRGGSMNCTAGEFTVSPVFSAAPGTPPFCVAGQSFSFQVDLGLSGTNADRYNVGFFVGQQGNDPTAATAGNICSVATFPTSPAPWSNFDGDACGDFAARGNQTTTINQIKVVCTADSVGALTIPYVVTYWQNTSSVCSGPADVTPSSPSKCNSGTSSVSGTVAVYSGAYVDVTKQTSPGGDSQPFTFTATGPAGSKVIALTGATLTPTTATGGTYTPATITAATNTTTATLTDGQTARFYINALAADQTLTITEAATANWEGTAAISCAAVAGSPAITTNNASRSLSATLNTTNTAAACTITNTKRSRITLTKNVGIRVDGNDQFTVSASGGGTLTGTTSATTAGSGTSSSTTFFSTPNTALTLTDAKASGPTALTAYDTRLTCTNAFAGQGATPNSGLPSNLITASTSITPAPGDDITCTYTNTKKVNLTLRKTWVNAIVNDAVNITATGLTTFSSVANSASETDTAAIQTARPGDVITIAESFTTGSATYYTAALSCTGTSGLSGSVLTVGAADTAIVCTQTNTRKVVNLTLRNTWVSAIVNDAVTIAATGLTSLNSVANSASETDTGTVQNVYAGDAITIAGTFTVGTAANYISVLSCSGNATTLAGNVLTVNSADTAIVCTQINTRKTVNLTLQKTWVNATVNDAVNFTATGLTTLNSVANSASETDTGAVQVVRAGDAITLAESFTVGSAANYTAALSCSGNATALSGNILTVNSADTAITCTYTNSLKQPSLTILKQASSATFLPGQDIIYTVTVTNTGSGVATNVILADKLSPFVAFCTNPFSPSLYPFDFAAGTSGLTFDPALIKYSNDFGASWTYAPLSAYDSAITNWQISFPAGSTMAPGNANFVLRYKAKVE